MARRMHGLHRTGGMADDSFRRASHQRVCQPCPSVRANDN
jgi:hypothetical protein